MPNVDITKLLRTLTEEGGSDLHLKVGSAPIVRVDGELRHLDLPRLTHQETSAIAQAILPADRRSRLEEKKEVDFALSVAGLGRFTNNNWHTDLYEQRSGHWQLIWSQTTSIGALPTPTQP